MYYWWSGGQCLDLCFLSFVFSQRLDPGAGGAHH